MQTILNFDMPYYFEYSYKMPLSFKCMQFFKWKFSEQN